MFEGRPMEKGQQLLCMALTVEVVRRHIYLALEETSWLLELDE